MNNKKDNEIKKEYTLYMHINKINRHFYIGITSLKPHQRFGKNGKYYKECVYFYNAIKKYGWDNFEHIIVAENLTKEQACKYEIDLIEHMKIERPNACYNILLGGELGRAGIVATEEYKEKFRGGKNPVAKSVICIETNKIFNTVTEASRFYKIDRRNIIRACQTGRTCGKLDGKRLHWAYYDKENNVYNLVKHKPHERKVYCETTRMYFISLQAAANFYNVPYDGIWRSCKYNTVTSYRFRWRYADDEGNEFRQAI